MIVFESIEVKFPKIKKRQIKSWLAKCLQSEGFKTGRINVIFCSDTFLLKINQQYLNHDYYTDIITFNYGEDNIASGDLFISVERVKENSQIFCVDSYQELCRVMVHGILHLTGQDDASDTDRYEMTQKENYYLSLL